MVDKVVKFLYILNLTTSFYSMKSGYFIKSLTKNNFKNEILLGNFPVILLYLPPSFLNVFQAVIG